MGLTRLAAFPYYGQESKSRSLMGSREPAFGLYDAVLTHDLRAFVDDPRLRARPVTSPLNRQDHPVHYLRQHVSNVIERILEATPMSRRVEVVNAIIDALAEVVPDAVSGSDYVTPKVLEALLRKAQFTEEADLTRPQIPLSRSALVTNEHSEHLIGSELKREIATADRIDCLCAFIKWSGLQQLGESIRRFTRHGGEMRVITTTYMQVTDQRAVDLLVKWGAKVKVSYDTGRTRLHAKAWLFHRDTDFTTAYIGSSNLSQSALMHGMEWNVRVSKVDARPIVEKFADVFTAYWTDDQLESYDGCDAHRKRLANALKPNGDPVVGTTGLKPYDFQQEMLQNLEVERFVHGRKNNLVVAATGTGKTVIAALDYRDLRARHRGKLSLLFVAHRREILDQSRRTFGLAVEDDEFGEIYAGGLRPEQGLHVFASVQSLANVKLADVDRHRFDMVIVDEFHHAAARTYKRLLDHFRPKYLLGLTATPERPDGQNVLQWFDGRMAAELRLWDAISRRLLVPFRYFGVSDDTDLSHVRWRGAQYDAADLTRLYTGDDLRVNIILRAVENRVLDITQMRAIGFCVSVRHAEFMADRFTRRGIPSVAITGQTRQADRAAVIGDLKRGKVNVLFTVDVLTEGVDIPEVDTVLLLRPTNSATVFLQQIGRGLRHCEGKDALVILDFIGQSRREYRFDFKFSALLGGKGQGGVRTAIEQRFPPLPAGCSIELDEQSRRIILGNLRRWINTSQKWLRALYRNLGSRTALREFLEESCLTAEEFYRKTCLTVLRQTDADTSAIKVGRKLKHILHVDDPERLRLYREAALGRLTRPVTDEHHRRLLMMMLCALYDRGVANDVEGYYNRLLNSPAICREIAEIADYLQEEIAHLPKSWPAPPHVPLKVHCRYSMHEIMAAFDVRSQQTGDLVQLRSGVYFEQKTRCNILLATVNKSEKYYTASTMYKVFARSPELFCWQSQHTTGTDSARGRRHTHSKEENVTPLLFVRQRKKNRYGMTEPYLFVGPVSCESHQGERPMDIVWRLATPMPADFVRRARLAA